MLFWKNFPHIFFYFQTPVAKYQNCYLHMNYASAEVQKRAGSPHPHIHSPRSSVGCTGGDECVCMQGGVWGRGTQAPLCLTAASLCCETRHPLQEAQRSASPTVPQGTTPPTPLRTPPVPCVEPASSADPSIKTRQRKHTITINTLHF